MSRICWLWARGPPLILAALAPPDVFGELALIDGGPRSASVQALEATTVLLVTRETFESVLGRRPEMNQALLHSLGSLVRRMIGQAADLVFLDLHGRVAKMLVLLADGQPGVAGGELSLGLGMTQSDLAAMVGGTRQSVNQILHSFERRGYLELRGQTLIVKDLDALRRRGGVG